MGVGWQCPKGERWLCPPTASALTAAGLGQDSGHVENTAERSGAGGLPDTVPRPPGSLCWDDQDASKCRPLGRRIQKRGGATGRKGLRSDPQG